MKQQVLNSKGEPIKLNHFEQARANALQEQYNRELKNALGYDIDITTLTSISRRIVEQKFFTIPIAQYVPLRVGEGAWSSEILTFREFATGGDFDQGLLNTGANNSRLAEVDAGVDSVKVPVMNWGKQISWSFMDLKMASRAGNWDLVTAKERSRKKNWDLGIQKVAFLGLPNRPDVDGLLTLDNVTANTTLITESISGMTAAEFSTFVQGIVGAFRANSNFTAMPNRLIMPESDFTALAAPVSTDFPVGNKFQYLLDSFKLITQNPNFQILPLAYANKAVNADIPGLNKNRYVLYNYDEDSVRMDIPVDYTNTLQNTINGFHFQNVGYGQFTGVQAYRPKEILYLDYA